jgi:hypothetical protein
MPERLYTAKEVAEMTGVARKWVYNHAGRAGAPRPQFEARYGGKDPIQLWTEDGVKHWYAYIASSDSMPQKASSRRFDNYSDHRAVNMIRGSMSTWKLWWRCTHDGGTLWWFSTPVGWWTSEDDGRTWSNTELDIRPNDYRYYCVNGSVTPKGALLGVLESATKLRHRLEKGSGQ